MLEKYYVSHGICWPCNFHFRYVTDKILFTQLQVYLDRSVAFNFSEYFSPFYTRRIELSSSFIKASSEIGRKMKSVQAKQRTCKDYVIGREKIAVNHDVAAFTFAARSCLLRQKRQFCVDFLRIYKIEVNSLAV